MTDYYDYYDYDYLKNAVSKMRDFLYNTFYNKYISAEIVEKYM
jgi:hypothetical protein